MTNPLLKPESIHTLSGVEPDLPRNDLAILGEIVASTIHLPGGCCIGFE